MKVSAQPWRQATTLAASLNSMWSSAIRIASANRTLISICPGCDSPLQSSTISPLPANARRIGAMTSSTIVVANVL